MTSLSSQATVMSSHPLEESSSRFSCNICLDAVQEPVVTQCGHLYCWPCLYKWLEPGLLPGERQSLTHGAWQAKPVDESRRVCPVCKAPCTIATIVPIYALIEPPEPSTTTTAATTTATQQKQHIIKSKTVQPRALNTIVSGEEETFDDDDGHDHDDHRIINSASVGPVEETTTANTPRRDNTLQRRRCLRIGTVIPARPTPLRRPRENNNDSGTTASSAAVYIATVPPAAAAAQRGSNNNALGMTGMASTFYQALLTDQVVLEDPDATAFLSRMLLLLGSFVVMCLFLF